MKIREFDIHYWYSWWEGLFDEATLEEKQQWFESELEVLYLWDH